MTRRGSVAPPERVNITYRPATGDAQQQVELPLKILAVGDYTGRAEDTPIEERKPIHIDKDSFDQVLAEHRVSVNIHVPNHLSSEEAEEMPVHLAFESLRDFEPEGVAQNVPELNTLLQLRAALTALKGPLGNVPAFRKRLQQLLSDEDARRSLITELGLDRSDASGGDAGANE